MNLLYHELDVLVPMYTIMYGKLTRNSKQSLPLDMVLTYDNWRAYVNIVIFISLMFF